MSLDLFFFFFLLTVSLVKKKKASVKQGSVFLSDEMRFSFTMIHVFINIYIVASFFFFPPLSNGLTRVNHSDVLPFYLLVFKFSIDLH